MSEETRRICKVIARSGLASRREAEAMVEDGRVQVNGELVHHPGHPVTPSDRIMVDDQPLPSPARHVYYLLNKPRGVITGRNDPDERKSVRGSEASSVVVTSSPIAPGSPPRWAKPQGDQVFVF